MREVLEPLKRRVRVMLEDQRTDMRHRPRVAHARRLIARQAEQDKRRSIGARLKITFHCEHLRRLVLQSIQPMRVPPPEFELG